MSTIFSEDDHIAHVISILRGSSTEDFALEEFVRVDGDRGFKDIAVKRGQRTLAVIEVKRPSKFKTQKAKQKASDQAIAYAEAEGCRFVAWTDGTTFVSQNLDTGFTQQGTLIGAARGKLGWRSEQPPTTFRPQWTEAEILEFPSEQRMLHPPLVNAEAYIPRLLPGVPLANMLNLPGTLHVVYGEADVGKSTLARATADDAAWNALFLDAILFGADIEPTIAAELQTIYGRVAPVQAFIERVHESSLRERGVPFGIVIDGFDEWSVPGAPNIGALSTLLQRMEAMGCKVLIFTRPTHRTYLELPQLRGFIAAGGTSHLGDLTDEELDRFVTVMFPLKRIGGELHGNARNICRNPGMFSMVTETYEDRSYVDPDLTEPQLYDRYRERKAQKLHATGRMNEQAFNVAIDRLALAMLRKEQFSLSFDDSVACAGAQDQIFALIGEGVLTRMGPTHTSPVRFRYGQFRDRALHLIARAHGVPTHELVSGIGAIRADEGRR